MTTITLSVSTFNGAPADGALSAQFDEMGGLIGRANTNQLVLPDPDRSISRVHAQVVFRGQHYAIVDRGSNPILVNGQAAGDGREVPLKEGDRITIGGYELVATVGVAGGAVAATAADPFADLLGTPTAPPGAAGGPGARGAGGLGKKRPAAIDPLTDPLAAFGAAAPAGPAPQTRPAAAATAAGAAAGIPDDWNPFAPDAAASSAATGTAPARGTARPAKGGDALGLELGAAAPAALIADFGPSSGGGGGGGDSLDALFGLKPGAGGGNAADPFAQSALDQPMAQPNMSANADPLKSLASAPRATSETLADTLSDLQRPFMAPPAVRPAPGTAASAAPAAGTAATASSSPPSALSAPVAPLPAPSPLAPSTFTPAAPSALFSPVSAPPAPPSARIPGAVLSWDAEPGDNHTVIRAAPRRDANPQASREPDVAAPTAATPVNTPPPARSPAAMPMLSPAPAPLSSSRDGDAADIDLSEVAPMTPMTPPSAGIGQPAATAPLRTATAAAAAAATADIQALQDAFLDGLGMPDLKFDGLTPDAMRLVGQLLREAAAGTVDLLVARAAFKREMQAEVTMIDARRNNPLKFSPSAEVALQHLLAPPARGFMAAAPAMRDAYVDLRAHQYGMVAGMRSALDGVLERFDPDQLESHLTQRSVLHSLLPGSRKARMWEVFVEHFDRIRAEATDDFQTLFGRAFVKAYEQRLDQIEQENGA